MQVIQRLSASLKPRSPAAAACWRFTLQYPATARVRPRKDRRCEVLTARRNGAHRPHTFASVDRLDTRSQCRSPTARNLLIAKTTSPWAQNMLRLAARPHGGMLVINVGRIFCLPALGLSCLVQAAPVTYSFSGSVTDDPFGLSSFGAPITGSFTFDSAAADGIADPATGSFASSGPGYGFSATVDGTNYVVSNAVVVTTGNGVAGADQYGAIASDATLTLEIFFQDDSATALASDALPPEPPALAAFGFRQFRLFSSDDSAQFLGTVDSLVCSVGCSVTPPPGVLSEPPAVLLYALLLAGLGLAGRHGAPPTARRA